jgi:ABC-type multidrug transport system fused ATPase/permease subunit
LWGSLYPSKRLLKTSLQIFVNHLTPSFVIPVRRAAQALPFEENSMQNHRLVHRILSAIALTVLMFASTGVAQQRPATPATGPVATPAPAPNEGDIRSTQTELIRLLRLSPTLTTVVSHDPSLLSNQEYVSRNNPQLAAFLAAHPEVARNPEFYLFSHLKHEDGQPDEALEKAVWPDVYRAQNPPSSFERVWSDLIPLLAFACGLVAIILLARMFIENRRWSRIFKMQSDVHGRLIERFTSNQELAVYMQSEAGRKFLEAAPLPVAFDQQQRVPSAVARVLAPLQTGIIMVLLGIGLLLLRHTEPGMNTPMLFFGTVVLMPGIGFIISAGVSWFLASRLGLMPSDTTQNRLDSSLGAAFRDRQ